MGMRSLPNGCTNRHEKGSCSWQGPAYGLRNSYRLSFFQKRANNGLNLNQIATYHNSIQTRYLHLKTWREMDMAMRLFSTPGFHFHQHKRRSNCLQVMNGTTSSFRSSRQYQKWTLICHTMNNKATPSNDIVSQCVFWTNERWNFLSLWDLAGFATLLNQHL